MDSRDKAGATTGDNRSDQIRMLTRDGRFREALPIATAVFATSPSAATGELLAEVARGAGEHEIELLAVAAGLALAGASSAVLRRLSLRLAEKGLVDLAALVAAETRDHYTTEAANVGITPSAADREAFLAQLPPEARGTTRPGADGQ